MNWNFKKNILFSLLYQITAALIGFILPRFFITRYGSEINGSIATIAQITNFLCILEAGMGSVASVAFYRCLAQKGSGDLTVVRNTVRRYYRNIGAVSLLICAVLAFLLPVFLDNGRSFGFNFELVLIIGCGFFIQYYLGATYQILLTADYKAYIHTATQILSIAANFAVSVLLIQLNADIRLVKLVSALVLLGRPVFLAWYVRRKYSLTDSPAIDNNLMKQRWNSFGQNLAFYIHLQTDMVVIMLFLSVKENSVYSIYASIITAIRTIIIAITSNFNPVIGRELIDSSKARVLNIFQKYIISHNFLANVLLSVTAVLIIPFMQIYSADFDYNYIRKGFAYLFCLSEYFYLYRTPYNSVINTCGHFKETQASAFIEAGLNVVLSVILVNFMGITGVVLGTAAAMLYRLVYCVVYVRKHLLSFKAADFAKSVAMSACTLLSVVAVFKWVNFSFVDSYPAFILAGIQTTLLFTLIQAVGFLLVYGKDLKDIKTVIRRK